MKPKDNSDNVLDSTTSSSEPRAATSNGKRKGRKRKPTENVSQSTGNEDDEFALFAKYIATELRQLPLHNALQCQEKIETIVEEERKYVESRQTEKDAVLIKEEPEEEEEELESVLIKEEPEEEEELESVLIKEEPEEEEEEEEEELESVLIKEEPKLMDEDFVDSQSHEQAMESVVIKQEPIISDELGNETIEAVINEKSPQNNIIKTEKISDSEL